MLIKLTDQCQMMCPHCMEDAKPKGRMMSMETFKNAVKFALHIGSLHQVLSGGEPTENDSILTMCAWLNAYNQDSIFTIVSNGMWLKDETRRMRIDFITHLDTFAGMQVYSNKKWYKEYNYVVEHKKEYEEYNKVVVDLDSEIHMKDLGRARFNEEAQKDVRQSGGFMSCINATLAARQSKEPCDVAIPLFLRGKFCTPSVDCDGNVHMSESRLCPSVGNVNTDSFDKIYESMKCFKPCGKCYHYKNFIESNSPMVVAARKIIGI